MKKLPLKCLVLAFAIILVGLAAAQSHLPVRFNDTAYNYYRGEDGVRTGYIHLAYDDEGLVVSLSDEVSPLKIKYDEMKQEKDAKGNKMPWRRWAVEEHVQSDGFAEGQRRGVTVLHQEAFLEPLMKAYNDALTDLGFSHATESTTSDTKVLIYSRDQGAMRVIFTRKGEDIRVRMTGV